MSGPTQVAWQLIRAFGVGLPLGLYYSFLRPLRRRTLADLFFAPALIYAWLQVGFGICGGDLRLGYFAPMVLGAILAIHLPGRWLSPAFRGFWRSFGATARWVRAFFQEMAKIFKKKR